MEPPFFGGGGRRGSAMAPLKRAVVNSYRLSIVTIALSVTIQPQFAIERLRLSNRQGVGDFVLCLLTLLVVLTGSRDFGSGRIRIFTGCGCRSGCNLIWIKAELHKMNISKRVGFFNSAVHFTQLN